MAPISQRRMTFQHDHARSKPDHEQQSVRDSLSGMTHLTAAAAGMSDHWNRANPICSRRSGSPLVPDSELGAVQAPNARWIIYFLGFLPRPIFFAVAARRSE